MITTTYQCDLCGESWSKSFPEDGPSEKRLHPIGLSDGTFLDICAPCKADIETEVENARQRFIVNMQARRKA